MADTTFVNGHYLSRAWRMMTQDKGWLAPMCILALSLYVPIFGALGVAGYGLCWARLTAWGVDAAPKQRGVRVGECIGAGWRAFVISLGWGLLAGIVASALAWMMDFAGTGGSIVLGILLVGLDIFAGLLVLVANLRGCIYQKIGAGFGFSQVWTMFAYDLGGLFRILGIAVLGGLVTAIPLAIAIFSMIPSVMSLLWGAYYSYATNSAALIATSVAGLIQSAMLPMLLASYVANVISVVAMLLVYTAGALWIRQFNVPVWGSPSDPVPLSSGSDPVPTGFYNPYPQPQPASQPQPSPAAQAASQSQAPVSAVAPGQPAAPAEPQPSLAEKPTPQPPVAEEQAAIGPSSSQAQEATPIQLVLDDQPQTDVEADVQEPTVDSHDGREEEADEYEDAPEPPIPGMGRPIADDDEGEIVTPLIVHKEDEEEGGEPEE